jgi:hypothetical protein
MDRTKSDKPKTKKLGKVKNTKKLTIEYKNKMIIEESQK